MAKSSVNPTLLIYLLIVTGFLALVLFSNDPSHPRARSHRRSLPGRRIKVRTGQSNKKHDPVAFDPVVAEFERKREDREWEKHYFESHYKHWGEQVEKNEAMHHTEHIEEPKMGAHADHYDIETDYQDPEDYLNDEDQFNITNRLTVLFPLLDTNPFDGFVSLAELQKWHFLQGQKTMQHRTDRELENHDKNHDGQVSFKEYLPHMSDEELGKNSSDFGDAGWFREQFEICDGNKDGLLNSTEFNDFLHPDDSNNPLVQKWSRQEQIRTHDTNKDEKISWEEFHNGMFEHIRDDNDPEHHHPEQEFEAKKQVQSKAQFLELDRNKDGFLTEDEIASIMEKLHPGELFYSKQQAKYLLEEADTNKDGRLTLDEMLNHPYIFYSTAYEQDEFDYSQHDEFR